MSSEPILGTIRNAQPFSEEVVLPLSSYADAAQLADSLSLVAMHARMVSLATGAAVALREEAKIVCRAAVGDAPAVGTELDANQGVCARCISECALIVRQDLEGEVRSVVAVPITAGVEARGFLAVFSSRPDAFTLRQIELVKHIAQTLCEEAPPQAWPTVTVAPVSPPIDAEAARPALMPPLPPQPTTSLPPLATVVRSVPRQPQGAVTLRTRARSFYLLLAGGVVLALLAGGFTTMRMSRAAKAIPQPAAPAAAASQQPTQTSQLSPEPTAAAPAPVGAAVKPPPVTQPKPTASGAAQTAAAEEQAIEIRRGATPKLPTPGEDDTAPVPSLRLDGHVLAKSLPAIGISAVASPRLETRSSPVQNIPEPKLLEKYPPRYPENAKQLHLGGKVLMAIEVAPDGHISKVTLLSGNAPFTEAAAAAVRLWRYDKLPASFGNVSRPVTVTVNFTTP